MNKILLSIATVALVGGLGIAATNAFFTDTETSTGNTFTAGTIDLKVSNTSYVSNQTTGELIASPNTSWINKDLVNEKFFNFNDLKPGDRGEDTIDLKVNTNDAWACAKLTLTSNKDNDCTAPELSSGNDTTCGMGDLNWNGDLAQEISFVWWADDGDNVLEKNEEATKYYLGPAAISNLLGPDNALDLTIADSQMNFFNGGPGHQTNPLVADTTYYIGKGWCFGEMVLTPVDEGEGSPITRGTGFGCNPFMTNNTAQTDSLTADMSFTVTQARNNMDYLCPEHQ